MNAAPQPPPSPAPSRRTFLRGTGSLAASLGLAGCGTRLPELGDSEHERLAATARTLGKGPLVVFYPRGSLGNLQPVAREFTALAGVEVELLEASLDEISAEMILRRETGGGDPGFDVALPATFGVPDLVESGVLEPLDELEAEYDPEARPRSLYTLGDRYRGKLYGYQTDGDAYLMFYHREWLEDEAERRRYLETHGVELAIPLTWEELDRQIRFFHRPEEGRCGGSLFRNANYVAWEYWIRLHAKGLCPLGEDLTPRFDTEEGVAALEELVQTTAFLDPMAREHGLFENFQSFASGNKYCNVGWGGTQKHLNGEGSDIRGKVAFGPLPGGEFGGQPVSMPYFNWGWNYVISSASRRKELAYLFILFATTPRVSTLSVRRRSGYFDPFRREHYADETIQETYGKDFLRVHGKSLGECIPDLYLRGQGEYLAALRTAVHAASGGQVSARVALGELSRKWETITDGVGREQQIEQWNRVRHSYPAHLQSLLA